MAPAWPNTVTTSAATVQRCCLQAYPVPELHQRRVRVEGCHEQRTKRGDQSCHGYGGSHAACQQSRPAFGVGGQPLVEVESIGGYIVLSVCASAYALTAAMVRTFSLSKLLMITGRSGRAITGMVISRTSHRLTWVPVSFGSNE